MGMYSVWMTPKNLEVRYRSPSLKASRATSLNPLGELFVLLLIIVVIVGALTHETLISAVGALAFVIAIVSRVWAALSLQDITIDRTASVDHAFQDDEIEITFTIDEGGTEKVVQIAVGKRVEGRNIYYMTCSLAPFIMTWGSSMVTHFELDVATRLFDPK